MKFNQNGTVLLQRASERESKKRFEMVGKICKTYVIENVRNKWKAPPPVTALCPSRTEIFLCQLGGNYYNGDALGLSVERRRLYAENEEKKTHGIYYYLFFFFVQFLGRGNLFARGRYGTRVCISLCANFGGNCGIIFLLMDPRTDNWFSKMSRYLVAIFRTNSTNVDNVGVRIMGTDFGKLF